MTRLLAKTARELIFAWSSAQETWRGLACPIYTSGNASGQERVHRKAARDAGNAFEHVMVEPKVVMGNGLRSAARQLNLTHFGRVWVSLLLIVALGARARLAKEGAFDGVDPACDDGGEDLERTEELSN